MFRDKNTIYVNSKSYGGNHDKSFIRTSKYSEELKKAKGKVNLIFNRIKNLEKAFIINEEKGNINYCNDIEKWLEKDRVLLIKAQKELKQLEAIKEKRHKCLKKSYKKRSKEWIKTEVLKIIEEAINNKEYFLHKEDVALRLSVKECFIEQVFMELNREGILSQAHHAPMHDCSRDPWTWGNGFSGWAGDTYYIRRKEEEKEED